MPPTTVTLTAVREYCQPADCTEPGCAYVDHPCCPDVWPDQWSEWVDPENPQTWLTEPADDPGEPVPLQLPVAQAIAFARRWHGAVWDASEGEFSTDDYRTGRESLDTLFISGPDAAVAAVLSHVN